MAGIFKTATPSTNRDQIFQTFPEFCLPHPHKETFQIFEILYFQSLRNFEI